MAKLGELYKITSGGTPSRTHSEYYEDGTIPWVKTGDLKDKYLFETDEKISQLGLENSSARIYLKNTVLLAMYGATIGATSILKIDAATNQACAAFSPREDVLPEYLYAFLESQKDRFTKDAVGGAQPNLSAGYLKNIEFGYPPLEQQIKITSTLNKIDELLLLRKQQIAKLDELVKARFVEMFGDSVANTKNFPSTTLETVMTVFPQNGLYKPQTDYVQDDTGIPILRIDAFYNGKVTNWNTLKRLICSETEIDRYLLRENDIVINRVNSIEYLGKCAHIVGLKEKTVFESNMMRFHMDEKKVNAVYVTEVLCTEDIYRQILRRAKKSVNQASINQEDVKSLEILVPPLSLQNQFAAFVERVDQQKQTVQQSLEKLELMKKALMQEYFG